MIRYAATNSGYRVVRSRSVVVIDWRSKSTQAAVNEGYHEDDINEGSRIQQQQHQRQQRHKPQSPPRFVSSDWRERLNHQFDKQKSKTSSWRTQQQLKPPQVKTDSSPLSDFFERRRQDPRPPPLPRDANFRQQNMRPPNKNVLRGPSKPPPPLGNNLNRAANENRPRSGWRKNGASSPPVFRKDNFQKETQALKSNTVSNMPEPTWRTRSPPKLPGPTSPISATPTTTTKLTGHADMTNVSRLREAFQNSLQRQSPPVIVEGATAQKQAWRQGGAKEYRQKQEVRKKEQQERRERYQRIQKAPKTFFPASAQTKNIVLKQQQDKQQEDDLQVLLPRSACSVAVFSSIVQVNKQAILNVLQDMGERSCHKDNYEMDVDTMELVTMELGYEPVRDQRKGAFRVEDDVNLLLQRRAAGAEEEEAAATENVYESFPPRPPVVACMGHVDHGKTTLTDALRRQSQPVQASSGKKKKKKKGKKAATTQQHKGDVAGTEAGGITQVISAFQIELESKKAAVTFLDTPGHAAFKSMRHSGSHAADVIVLVVAADDGVSRQTVEILDFYKSIVAEAGGGAISLVVAMTKIDKPGVDVDESKMRIANQLLEHGIVTEEFASSDSESEYGPPVQLIPVSGLTGEGLDELIEGLVLQSEVMDLRADHDARAEGIVMDARIEKGLGVVADCIVRWGSLERGNVVVSGVHSGKVKILKDVYGKTLNNATPSQPVRIIGFESLPKAGDPVVCVSSEEKAKRLVEKRLEHLDKSAKDLSFRTQNDTDPDFQVTGTASKTIHMTAMAEDKYDIEGDANSNTIRIPVLIKADADGTLAAVRDSLLEVGSMSSNYDIVVDPVGMGIGPILTSDVALAQQSGAAIFSFGLDNLNDKSTVQLAENDGVTVRSHNVIYSLLDDAKDVFAQHLPPAPVEVIHGSATVKAVFNINNKRNAEVIAGLNVLDGTLHKDKTVSDSRTTLDCHYRVLRNGERVSPPGETIRASSLKRVKENVDDVRRGEECGLGLDGFSDFQEGDVIECYSIEMKRVFV